MMMSSLCIFLVVLFIYMHISYQLKVSNEFEVYEVEDNDKQSIHETCETRQPVIVKKVYHEEMDQIFSYQHIFQTYSVFDLHVRKCMESDSVEDSFYISLKAIMVQKLFESMIPPSSSSSYFSENNEEFLLTTGLYKKIQEYSNDLFSLPLCTSIKYDMLLGSTGSYTPLRYSLENRTVLHILNGNIKVKLIPPCFMQYLHVYKNYDLLEFISAIDVWNIQSQYVDIFNKVKMIELDLKKSSVIIIPSYWFYSLSFGVETVVIQSKYSTIMNSVTHLPDYVLYFLQQQNKCIKPTKPMDIKIDDRVHVPPPQEDVVKKQSLKKKKQQ